MQGSPGLLKQKDPTSLFTQLCPVQPKPRAQTWPSECGSTELPHVGPPLHLGHGHGHAGHSSKVSWSILELAQLVQMPLKCQHLAASLGGFFAPDRQAGISLPAVDLSRGT